MRVNHEVHQLGTDTAIPAERSTSVSCVPCMSILSESQHSCQAAAWQGKARQGKAHQGRRSTPGSPPAAWRWCGYVKEYWNKTGQLGTVCKQKQVSGGRYSDYCKLNPA